MNMQAPETSRLDGSFELVTHANDAAIIRRPVLKQLNGIPCLVAGFELCRLSPDAPEDFVTKLLDTLNDANAWGQI
jgi:hypothetical protein